MLILFSTHLSNIFVYVYQKVNIIKCLKWQQKNILRFSLYLLTAINLNIGHMYSEAKGVIRTLKVMIDCLYFIVFAFYFMHMILDTSVYSKLFFIMSNSNFAFIVFKCYVIPPMTNLLYICNCTFSGNVIFRHDKYLKIYR